MSQHFISYQDARENLLACATFLAEDIKSSDGHSEAMRVIVPFYLAKGEVDLAAELADSIDDPFTRDRLLTLVAENCAAINDDDYAFQLVEAIEDYGGQAQARERIALQKSAQGDFEKALEIARALEHPDNIFAAVAVDSAGKNDNETSADALKQIEYPLAKAVALQNIALQKLQKGEKAKTLELLENALEAANEIDYAEEKIRALSDIANHFTEAKRSDRAIETFDKAKQSAEKLDNAHRDAFLANIAYGFLRAGSLELADRTLDLVQDKTQMSSCLVGFAREFWTKGEKDEALETLEEAYAILKSQHERETRDSRAKFALFSTIAAQFAGFEKAERALEAAQQIPDENEQMSALAQTAQVLTLAGNEDLALQAVRAIREDLQKMFAFIGVSDAKNRLEEKEDAIKYLNEAYFHSGLVRQFASRSTAFIELARRFDDYGETEKAREITRENLETIAQIRDESSQSVALANLAELYEQKDFTLTDAEKEILRAMLIKVER